MLRTPAKLVSSGDDLDIAHAGIELSLDQRQGPPDGVAAPADNEVAGGSPQLVADLADVGPYLADSSSMKSVQFEQEERTKRASIVLKELAEVQTQEVAAQNDYDDVEDAASTMADAKKQLEQLQIQSRLGSISSPRGQRTSTAMMAEVRPLCHSHLLHG